MIVAPVLRAAIMRIKGFLVFSWQNGGCDFLLVDCSVMTTKDYLQNQLIFGEQHSVFFMRMKKGSKANCPVCLLLFEKIWIFFKKKKKAFGLFKLPLCVSCLHFVPPTFLEFLQYNEKSV